MEFREYVKKLLPVVFRDFKHGDIEAKDTYNRDTSIVGSPYFEKCNKGYYLNGHLSIIDGGITPELQFVTGTLIVFVRSFDPSVITQRLICKRNFPVGGVTYDWYVSNVNRLGIYAGGSTATLTSTDFKYAKMLACSFSHNNPVSYYANGEYIGDSAISIPITPSTDDFHMGHLSGSFSLTTSVRCYIAYNKILTSDQINDMYRLYLEESFKVHSSIYIRPKKLVIGSEIINIQGKVQSNKVVDESQGLLFDRSGLQVVHGGENDSPSGRYIKSSGGNVGEARIEITDSSLDDLVPISLSFWIRPNGTQETQGTIYSKGASLLHLYYNESDKRIYLSESWSGGTALWYFPTSLIDALWVHIVIRHSGLVGEIPTISINGTTPVDMTVSSASSGTKNSDVGVCSLLDLSTGTREFNGDIADFRVYNEIITYNQILDLYHIGALTFYIPNYNLPVSLATQVFIDKIGPYQLFSGSASFDYDDNKLSNRIMKTLGSNSDFGCKSLNNTNYGAWYWKSKFYSSSPGVISFVMFTVDNIQPLLSGFTNGYYFYRDGSNISFARVTDGSGTLLVSNVLTSIVHDTEYEFFVTHNYNGAFRLWIRGGSYSSWTESITLANDTVHFNGGFFASRGQSNDEFSDFIVFPYGGGIIPNDISWLSD